MEGKEKREIPIKPVILKFGLALAISLGGVVFTYIRIKRIKCPKPPKSKPSSPGNVNQLAADSKTESVEIKDVDHALQINNPSPKAVSSQNSISDMSSGGDRNSYFLQEFNDLVKECNMSLTMDNVCPKNNGETVFLDVDYKCDEHEREIKRLRNLVKILQEKERNLELQLLEYYGIKEQETAVMELQNQLKFNTMEAKLYNLKIESLLLDNRRLEAQVADYANSANELEAAKAKMKMLKKKLKFEVEKNREQILKLQDRVMKLQEEERRVAEIDQEREYLKIKLEDMRKINQALEEENCDLVQKLDYIRMIAPNALEHDEVLELKEETQRLKLQIEESRKEIERIHGCRGRDLEELVYLRWMNACLRYELRNNQPEGGKTIAMEKLEDEAKKLILEYANNEGPGDKMLTDTGYMDSDQWSCSQASCLTDHEREDLPVDPLEPNKTSSTSSKKKLFSKLRRLLRGKGSSSRESQGSRTPPVENIIPGRLSCEFPTDGDVLKASRSSSRGSSRRSLDIPRSYSRGAKSMVGGSSSYSRRTCDDDFSSVLTRDESLTEFNSNWSPAAFQQDQDGDTSSKEDLLKFAEALKNCRRKSPRSMISYESS